MASIASQLQAIKSVLNLAPDQIRRPQTRASVIFDPKEAADIDLRTILPIALSGLDVLIDLEERFRSYRDTLFSQTSLDLNREMMTQKENEKLNKSINSYLRLLSGNLQLSAALKTLEYLIRRYQVHVYNMEELILCALPYHDTHAFVRIVQLIELGNTKWGFLEGSKSSGAPPPRHVLVQQCIRDKGLLETLCNYASPSKEFQHSRPVICFCTAVIVESLGAIAELDTDSVQRVLGFLFNALNPALGGDRDHKAGALMIVGLLATRATLAPKLVQNLIFFVSRAAQQDAIESIDLPWLRVTIMAIISLVQSQPVQMFPKKSAVVLKEIRDFEGILSQLSSEFNIQKFINIYTESLINYSATDDSCFLALINFMERFPLKNYVEKIVPKVLAYCVKVGRSTDNSNSSEIGKWAKKILVVIENRYPSELRGAIRKFLENFEMRAKKEASISETLGLLLDASGDSPAGTSDSKIWFSLEHPKAAVRQSALKKIAASGISEKIASNPQESVNMQDAIIRGMHDEDLSVVQSALSIDGINGFINPHSILKAYNHILSNCLEIINKGGSKASRACDVSISALERLVEIQSIHLDHAKDIATILFPLLIVRPKTWKVNLKALDLVKQIQWPFFAEILVSQDPVSCDQIQNMDSKIAASINKKTVETFSKTFVANPKEFIGWLVVCGKQSNLSKSLYLLIVLHALSAYNKGFERFMELYQTCFPALKNDWCELGDLGNISLHEEESYMEKTDRYCSELVHNLYGMDFEAVHAKTLICIFWLILKAYSSTANQNNSVGNEEKESVLEELFLFFIAGPTKNVLEKHVQFLLVNCIGTPFRFLSKYFAQEGFSLEVQVETLRLFALVGASCSDENLNLQLLLGFPSLLIPLSHEKKDIRTSAMNCIEVLFTVWQNFNTSLSKNGSNNRVPQCMSSPIFGVFLESLISQKKMISSDSNFLSSYLTAMLSSFGHDLSVPDNIRDRFDQPAKDAILLFILNSALTFSSYGKLTVLSLVKGMGNNIFKIEQVKSLLDNLMERRNQYQFEIDNKEEKLSVHEIEILCLLLEVSLSASHCTDIDATILDAVIKALRADVVSPECPAFVRPIVTILQALRPDFYNSLKTEIQDKFFGNFILLLRNENAEIRNAARDTLLQINIGYSTVSRLIDVILAKGVEKFESSGRIKRKKDQSESFPDLFQYPSGKEQHPIFVLIPLLDILLLKKDTEKRVNMVKPLLQVLRKLYDAESVQALFGQKERENMNFDEEDESVSVALFQARQTVLIILKEITDLLQSDIYQDELFNKGDTELLVECARFSKDASTRNHIFLLLASVSRISPQLISENIISIFTVIGDCAIKQEDSHSQHVVEDLIANLVPCWLSRTTSIEKLLQIFIEALPDLAEHRRLMLMVYLSRTLGEECSLGSVLYLLLHSLVKKFLESSRSLQELFSYEQLEEYWEYVLALQLCEQYSCKVWFPCLVNLIQEIELHDQEGQFGDLFLGLMFILYKLKDTELVFDLESQQNADYLQVTLGALMEQIVCQSQIASVRGKQLGINTDLLKEFKDLTHRVLKSITVWTVPSTFFQSITQLLSQESASVRRKALSLLCETLKEQSNPSHKKQKGARKSNRKSTLSHTQLDQGGAHSFAELCSKLVQLIDSKTEDSVKIPSISSMEVLSKNYPTLDIHTACLTSTLNQIGSTNPLISAVAIRTAGALITVLGSRALPQLPLITNQVIKRAHDFSVCPVNKKKSTGGESGGGAEGVTVLLSVVSILEVIVEKLGGFLNPYLEDLLDLLLLHREFVSDSDEKIKAKADSVRKLFTDKIPVRLMLGPLLQIYKNATECGEASLCLTFQMIANLVSSMDRPSINTYHAKVFNHCLTALDLRRQISNPVKNVNKIEERVINAITVLTMRLTETMFRPLFLHSIEWAESESEGGSDSVFNRRSLDRAISFFNLVNKLAEQHRSLFVPYFKYLLEGCVRYLSGDEDIGLKRKKKKAKTGDLNVKSQEEKTGDLNVKSQEEKDQIANQKHWHLSVLIVKALHKCFVYDTDSKILDSSNFEVLLKPIVSQMTMEPPVPASDDVPTGEEMDESLVLCLGQMAVTARSDVLWKPLNHEVLMQTRSEKIRPKILGLKVVKYLVENLKEEYLVFIPETIPFLGELLEDAELSVKTLAQEILKEMESLSGESLRQYL